MARSAGGTAYWLADRAGQVASCGTAPDLARPFASDAPIVGIAAAPIGEGYWLVAADGGVFSFGNARFHGSMGGKPLNAPVVGMAADPSGGAGAEASDRGYWLVAADGGVFSFGSTFYGSGA